MPGDVIHLLEPQLSTVPADIFLLSGDAIVNESMLTGESVPVSKIPVSDEVLAGWRESRDIEGDAAKSFLYAGTKVVRIRKAVGTENAPDRPAIGIVVRTGAFNTLSDLASANVGAIRLQHDQRCSRALDAFPQTYGIQVLSRLHQVHHCSSMHRRTRLLRQRSPIRTARRTLAHHHPPRS